MVLSATTNDHMLVQSDTKLSGGLEDATVHLLVLQIEVWLAVYPGQSGLGAQWPSPSEQDACQEYLGSIN